MSPPTANENTLKVFCRFRTLPKTEISFNYSIDDKSVHLNQQVSGKPKSDDTTLRTTYNFTKVFDKSSTQKEVFDTCCLESIKKLLSGEESLLFLYGVTGSGKTYTMNGTSLNPGLVPYSINLVFNSIGATSKKVVESDGQNGYVFRSAFSETAHTVFVSYVEIYNNSVYDMLDEEMLNSKLIREDKQHKCYVQNAVEVEVGNYDEAMNLLEKGNKRRKRHETSLNPNSSRSHVVFNVRLVRIIEGRIIHSSMTFVDLAGSERQNRTQNEGVRLKEAGCINNSLMALRGCIECLRDNQTGGDHKLVPYRNSKLTLLFKYYFDGNGHVSMIVCCKPAISDYQENIKVFQFAQMARQVTIQRVGVDCCSRIPPFEVDIPPMEINSMRDVDMFCVYLEKAIGLAKPICDMVSGLVEKEETERNVLPSQIAAKERQARLAARPILSKTPIKYNKDKIMTTRNAMTPNPKRTRFIL